MALGTIKVEMLESVDGVDYVLDPTPLGINVSQGLSLILCEVKPGVRFAKIRITEESVGPIGIGKCIAGIM